MLGVGTSASTVNIRHITYCVSGIRSIVCWVFGHQPLCIRHIACCVLGNRSIVCWVLGHRPYVLGILHIMYHVLGLLRIGHCDVSS